VLLNLKGFRVTKGYTQREFAELLNMKKLAYFQLENGRTDVKKKHMDRILELYPSENIDVMELFKDFKEEGKHETI
jgi:transcriptional regulator with XRE-family HTH domain